MESCPHFFDHVASSSANIDHHHCLNNCGGKAASGCWCDGTCAEYGDCCDDMLVNCPEYKAKLSHPSQTTCKGVCGSHTASCWCDGGCLQTGDCCEDFEEICLESRTAALKSCDKFCGKQHPSGCYCDGSCISDGDCCPDYSLVCNSAEVKSDAYTYEEPTFNDAQSELSYNRLFFKASGLTMYSFHYKHFCDICTEEYSQEKIITYTESQGIVSIVELSGEELGVDQYSDYRLIEPGLFNFIQAAINEEVPEMTVGYDTSYGFPVLIEIDWGGKEYDRFYITGFEELSGHLQGCTDDLRQCPDGSAKLRDPENKCSFKKCSAIPVLGGDMIDPNEPLHLCESRTSTTGKCFGTTSRILSGTPAEVCSAFFNENIGLWTKTAIEHFTSCVESESLCDKTIEDCMRQGELKDQRKEIEEARQVWDSLKLRVYSFLYQKTCTTCPEEYQSPKVITVNVQMGITGMMDAQTGKAVPAREWKYYLSLGDVFLLLERAIRENANLKVEYDEESGLISYFNIDWGTSRSANASEWRESSAKVSKFTNLGQNVLDCSREKKMCPDGTYVKRDPTKNCDFDVCTLGTEGSVDEAYDWCNPRQERDSWCWVEGPTKSPSNNPTDACFDYYVKKISLWLPEHKKAFKQCSQSRSLCSETIEDCMEEYEFIQFELISQRNKWNAHGLLYYQFNFIQDCTGCQERYMTEKLITVEKDVGIRDLIDFRTRQGVPPEEWRYFRSVEAMFDLVQEALDEPASKISVTYDPTYGFPVSLYIDWLPSSSKDTDTSRIDIYGFEDLGQPELACGADKKRCPDGSLVERDPRNNCNFLSCPVGQGIFVQATSICKHRVAEAGWCWMQGTEKVPGKSDPAERCIRYFTEAFNQMNAEEVGLFRQCTSTHKLCDQSIEACMYRLGDFMKSVQERKSKWIARQITRYQYHYDQTCPACTDADMSTKLVTVDEAAGGVTSVFDIDKKMGVPVYQWADYKTIPELFDLVETAISAVPTITKAYIYGQKGSRFMHKNMFPHDHW